MSPRRRPVPIALAAALGLGVAATACAPVPPPTPLPGPLAEGPYSPGGNALYGAAEAFARPGGPSEGGDAAAGAVALARLEWVAAEWARDPAPYRRRSPLAEASLGAARSEARSAAGIAQGASPEVVIEALSRAAGALRSGDGAGARGALRAAGPGTFAPDALERIAALPRLPQANAATQRALREVEFAPFDRGPYAGVGLGVGGFGFGGGGGGGGFRGGGVGVGIGFRL